MKVKVIIFDLDDTLYDEITFVKSGFLAVATHFAPQNPHIMLKKMISVLEERGRGEVFDVSLRHFGFYSKKNIKKALSIYRTHTPTIELNRDAKEILKYYKSQNVPLYIVTDGNKMVQANKIKALKLENQIKKAFITHRYGTIHAKPSPYCFCKIAALESVKFEEIVYIADNITKDFIEIKKLGFHTVRIKQGMFKDVEKNPEFHAHVTINSLKELKQLLKVEL